MQAGFVGFGILSGLTAALFVIGAAGAGILSALLAYSGTGALVVLGAVLGAVLPCRPQDPLTQG